MFYSQGNGFNTPLSIFYILYTLSLVLWSVIGLGYVLGVPWYGDVLPRTTLIKIMCVHYLHLQR